MNYEQHKLAQELVQKAQDIQFNRYNSSTKYNNSLSTKELKSIIHPSEEALSLLNAATEKLALSARSYFKILKVAQTIADMESAESITAAHVSEALQYRQPTPLS